MDCLGNDLECTQSNEPVEVASCARFDPEVVEAVWEAVEDLIPNQSIRIRWDVTAVESRTGSVSWVSSSVWSRGARGRTPNGCWVTRSRTRPCGPAATSGSKPGVFDQLVDEALAGYDKIIGLDLSEVAVDGSQHKAPSRGEGTGSTPPTGVNKAGNGPWPLTATASVELRAAPTQHRPVHPPPTRPTRPRHHPAHHRRTHRLAQPLEAQHNPYPLSLWGSAVPVRCSSAGC